MVLVQDWQQLSGTKEENIGEELILECGTRESSAGFITDTFRTDIRPHIVTACIPHEPWKW